MRRLLHALFFYKRLILPSLVGAALLPAISIAKTGYFSLILMGLYYIPISLLFHYIIYERRNPHEYFFFYNLGLTKRLLWLTTGICGLTIAIVLAVIA